MALHLKEFKSEQCLTRCLVHGLFCPNLLLGATIERDVSTWQLESPLVALGFDNWHAAGLAKFLSLPFIYYSHQTHLR